MSQANETSSEESGFTDLKQDDPLSQDMNSSWARYFKACEVKRVISQDVDRTFPDLYFFRSPRVRLAMVNVLFCYVGETGTRYYQGMHEILAPLIFTLNSDYAAAQHARELTPNAFSRAPEELTCLLDSDHLEADAFAMFSHILAIIRPWYVVDDRHSTEETKPKSFKRFFDTSPELPNSLTHSVKTAAAGKSSPDGVAFVQSIHEDVLQKQDKALSNHLTQLEITPAIFGLRWVRLLFGHEFPMQDLLFIWDCLFAVNERFVLVPYVYTAMLLLIRSFLVERDFADCLCLLMRYPAGVDVTHLVNLALHLHKPNVYPRPPQSRMPVRLPATTVSARYAAVSPCEAPTPAPAAATSASGRRRSRAPRNRTLTSLEIFTSRWPDFVSKMSLGASRAIPAPGPACAPESVARSGPSLPATASVATVGKNAWLDASDMQRRLTETCRSCATTLATANRRLDLVALATITSAAAANSGGDYVSLVTATSSATEKQQDTARLDQLRQAQVELNVVRSMLLHLVSCELAVATTEPTPLATDSGITRQVEGGVDATMLAVKALDSKPFASAPSQPMCVAPDAGDDQATRTTRHGLGQVLLGPTRIAPTPPPGPISMSSSFRVPLDAADGGSGGSSGGVSGSGDGGHCRPRKRGTSLTSPGPGFARHLDNEATLAAVVTVDDAPLDPHRLAAGVSVALQELSRSPLLTKLHQLSC